MTKTRLGEFELLVLAALVQLGDEAYGVSVRQEIEDRTGRSTSVGAVYTTLSRLGERGFVESRLGQPTPQRGGRAKRYFTVTPAGRAALRSTLAAVERITEGLGLT
jgi:DNA-binding PadR family transcriptional regulator